MRPTTKPFRFVSCVCALCMSSEIELKHGCGPLHIFPFLAVASPFSLQSLTTLPTPKTPIQLQLAFLVLLVDVNRLWVAG